MPFSRIALSRDDTKKPSSFEFHPEHNHWHIGDVALFEVRKAKDNGTGGAWGKPFVNDQGQAQSIKTTFCLIDWYKVDDYSPRTERVYWEGATSYQGISPGWVDQYHQEIEGQQLDLTGAPPGVYYLVSTANPDGNFLEAKPRTTRRGRASVCAGTARGTPRSRRSPTPPATCPACAASRPPTAEPCRATLTLCVR